MLAADPSLADPELPEMQFYRRVKTGKGKVRDAASLPAPSTPMLASAPSDGPSARKLLTPAAETALRYHYEKQGWPWDYGVRLGFTRQTPEPWATSTTLQMKRGETAA